LASPVAAASAAYFERGSSNTTWLGINGVAMIAEHPQPSACPTTNSASRPEGVNCQLTRYGVAMNVFFARTRSRDSRDVENPSPTKQLLASNQTIAGAKLVFSCALPSGTGC
jgi:hypothetical protein